jgi:formiminotetrahydrofolate cyclodeaminase
MTMLESRSLGDLLEQVAAKTPTPGGGAVACAAGALAAALAHMVVSYSLGKKNLAEHQPILENAAGVLTRARAVFLGLAAEDAEAYGLVNELQRLAEGDPRRRAELAGAIEAAIQAPMAALAAAADLLRLCERLAPRTNRHLRSDLAIAAVLAESTARACVWNVRVNVGLLPDPASRDRRLRQAVEMAEECSARRAVVERECGAE